MLHLTHLTRFTQYRRFFFLALFCLLFHGLLDHAVAYAQLPLPYPVTQPPVLTSSSRPSSLTAVNNKLYFLTLQNDLWQSDGTRENTRLIKALGSCNTDFGCVPQMVMRQGVLYISQGNILWRSDGTADGTFSILAAQHAVSGLTQLAGTLYFTLDGRLWKSDGTAAGTTMIEGLAPGGFSCPIVFKALLYCRVGNELWRSDGTAAGTTRLRTIAINEIDLYYHTVFIAGEQSFYFLISGPSVSELWKSDGTEAGTTRVAQFTIEMNEQHQLLAIQGNRLYFALYRGLFQYELWRSDGDGASTIQLAEMPTPYLATLNNKIYFFSRQDPLTGTELWQSDGTPGGTQLLKDINPGVADAGPQPLLSSGSLLYFFADDGQHGMELWRSDGSAAGTALLKDIYPGPDGSVDEATSLTKLGQNGEVFFKAYGPGVGYELWKSNGADTTLVRDIEPKVGNDFNLWPTPVAMIGNRIFFYNDDGSLTFKLWVSDGTIAGTQALANPTMGINSWEFYRYDVASTSNTLYILSNQLPLARLNISTIWQIDITAQGIQEKKRWTSGDNNRIVSLATTANHLFATVNRRHLVPFESYELWVVGQGETPSQRLVAWPGSPSEFLAIGDVLYFSALTPTGSPLALWRSDGTITGTNVLKELPVRELSALNGMLFIRTNGDSAAAGLWKSGGSSAGTMLLKTGNVISLMPAGDRLYFMIWTESGVELWQSDGSVEGTSKVLLPTEATEPTDLFSFDDKLFFWSKSDTTRTLWRTDGTTAGTIAIKTFATPGCGGAMVTTHHFYLFCGSANVFTLWQSDGTPAGTLAITEFMSSQQASAAASQPKSALDTAEQIYFPIEDRLWVLDERMIEKGFLPVVVK